MLLNFLQCISGDNIRNRDKQLNANDSRKLLIYLLQCCALVGKLSARSNFTLQTQSCAVICNRDFLRESVAHLMCVETPFNSIFKTKCIT